MSKIKLTSKLSPAQRRSFHNSIPKDEHGTHLKPGPLIGPQRRRIKILTYFGFNSFNPLKGSYDSLLELAEEVESGHIGTIKNLLMFNLHNQLYWISSWKSNKRESIVSFARIDRDFALRNFISHARNFLSERDNTILTYPQAYNSIEKICNSVAREVIGRDNYVIEKVSPKP